MAITYEYKIANLEYTNDDSKGVVVAHYPSVDAVNSPCVDICELDSDFVCIGCGRTIDEVLKWREYTDEQKKAALDRIFKGS